MTELTAIIFSSFWTWLGFIIMLPLLIVVLLVIGSVIVDVVTAICSARRK